MSSFLERLWYPDGPEPLGKKLLLAPLDGLALGFGALSLARSALYDRGLLPAHEVEGVRVVSIGNLTVGGAGKTPVVIHLANLARQRGLKVAVLSRGYGRGSTKPLLIGGDSRPSAEEAGDEPLLISWRCPGVPVLVGADRVERARFARSELGTELLLLDDGMQHRRLSRQLDIAVVDEAVGLGNGRMLPRGPLREPPSALARAQLLWVKEASPGRWAPPPGARVVRARHSVTSVRAPDGTTHPLAVLADRPVIAFAGLARPSGFLASVRAAGAAVEETRLFPDHHRFTASELRALDAEARRSGALLVTTEKDAVRLPAGFQAWVLRLEVQVIEGAALIEAALA